MFEVPLDSLFDIFKNPQAGWYDRILEKPVLVKVRLENQKIWDSEMEGWVIYITKASFMELILNRVFVCEQYQIKIQI